MAASLRNFFITFVLAFAVFGGLAYYYYGDLVALLPQNAAEESEPEVSGGISADNSESSSGGEISLGPDDGDGLGILHGLIVTKNEDGEALSARFIRINSVRREVIACNLSMGAGLYNDVGAVVPLRDYLRIYSGETASAAICSLTGYQADFYLELMPDSLDELVSNMLEPHYLVAQEIKYVNPIYKDVVFPDGVALPTDYYKYVPSGEVTLNTDIVAMIREHYSACDGSDGHQSYDSVLSGIYESLLDQLFKEQRLFMENDTSRFAAALSGAQTNLNEAFLAEKATILMKYMDEKYLTKEIPYTTRDNTVYEFKMADK